MLVGLCPTSDGGSMSYQCWWVYVLPVLVGLCPTSVGGLEGTIAEVLPLEQKVLGLGH